MSPDFHRRHVVDGGPSPGGFILSVLVACVFLTFHSKVEAAIRTGGGLSDNTLARNDDGSTGAVNLGFTINYLGTSRSAAFVNNNGNLTFGSAFATFTPTALSGTSRDIIAPFWADVDTDPFGDAVTYGTATINGRSAFAANYVNVDYFNSSPAHGAQLNDFQVVLFSRSDVSASDFDIEFNYEDINWEAGDADDGAGDDGLGGTTARAGFGNTANTISFEVAGAGTVGAYLDANASTGLINASNIAVPSRQYFLVRDGRAIVPGRDDLMLAASADSQKSVAKVLDAHLIASTGDMGRVISQIYVLPDADSKRNALDELHPVVNGDIAQTSVTAVNQFLATINSRLGAFHGGLASGASGISTGNMFKGIGAWVQGFGNHAKQKARKGFEGYQANVFGTALGFDRFFGTHIQAGLSGGYSFSDINSKAEGRRQTDVHSYQGALYASYHSREQGLWPQVNSYYVDGIFAFSHHDYDGKREIRFGTIDRVAEADYPGQQYSFKMEGGLPLKYLKTKNLEITPVASFEYSYLHTHDYTEKGAASLNLSVESQGYHTLEHGFGLQTGYPLFWKRFGTFAPKIRGMWLYDYKGDKTETTASFAGGGTSFRTVGASPAKHAFLLVSELSFLSKDVFSLTARYDLEIKDRFFGHSYYLTLRYDL